MTLWPTKMVPANLAAVADPPRWAPSQAFVAGLHHAVFVGILVQKDQRLAALVPHRRRVLGTADKHLRGRPRRTEVGAAADDNRRALRKADQHAARPDHPEDD